MKDLNLAQELIAQSMAHTEASDAIITKTAELRATNPNGNSGLSSGVKVDCFASDYLLIGVAIQLGGGDGVSNGLPLASYLDKVRPIRTYDAIEFHKWGISRRVTALCVAAVEEREPYLTDVYSELAGVH